jgi:heme A synthase
MSLISLLIAIIVLGLLAYLLWWGVAAIGLPDPFNKVARAVVILIVVVLVLGVFTGTITVPVLRL